MGAAVPQKRKNRSRRRRHAQSGVMSEINVTPFVDVMLVLLIIFMVAAPLLTVGVEVELPETAAGALSADPEDPLTVVLAGDGRVLLQSAEVERADLITRLAAVAAERDDQRVYLRADANLPHGQVAEVMGALKAGGFNQIVFVQDSGGPRLDGQGG